MNSIETVAVDDNDDDMCVRTLYCEQISLLVDQSLGLTVAAAR